MTCNFSCFLSFTDAQKENDLGVFQSDNGDVYKVKYKSNVCRDLLLRIEWTIPKQILFTVKLYSTTFKRCFSSKGMVVNGKKAFMKLRGAFNVSNSRNYKVLCVINLIPYIKFNDNNELPVDLLNNSGGVESEFQESLMNENNAVTYEEINFKNENTEENEDVTKNFNVKVNEINIPNKCENARSVNEMVHVSSGKSDFKLGNIAITDGMVIEESNSENIALDKSEKSVSLMNKDSLISCDYGDKMIKNKNVHTINIQNSENKIQPDVACIDFESSKNNLRSNFTGNHEDSLIRNSDKRNGESVSSNDISSEENVFDKNNSKAEIFITKILTLDDYSEEITENMKIINIHNTESNDTFSENSSSMDVDLPELSSDNNCALDNEDTSSGSSHNKTSENLSTNIDQDKSQTEVMGFHELPENKDIGYSKGVVKSVTNSKVMKTNCILESSDISMNKNHDDEKHYGEKCLTKLSNGSMDSHIQNSDLSKIDNGVNSSILNSDPLSPDTPKSPDCEINDSKTDSHKSPKLSSSKARLIFKTLVRDLQVTDVKDEMASSSDSLRDSQESEADNRKIFPNMENEIKGLSMDMLDLLNSGDMADAQITNGEKHMKVHRAIVSARSPALRKLFIKHKTDDINCNVVVDIPSYIFEDVIIFLYVGLVYIKSTKMAQDLHEAAERYCINDLIDICSKYI